jgi:hypothetical protein
MPGDVTHDAIPYDDWFIRRWNDPDSFHEASTVVLVDGVPAALRAGVCAACQNRKGDQQGIRSYPRRRSAVSIATSTRDVIPGTSTGRRPAT